VSGKTAGLQFTGDKFAEADVEIDDDRNASRGKDRMLYKLREDPDVSGGGIRRTAVTLKDSCYNPEVQVRLRTKLPNNDIKEKKLSNFHNYQ
jgi:hypothetical protein